MIQAFLYGTTDNPILVDPITQALGGWLQDINIASISIRLVMAIILAAIIGLDRANQRQAAGLRTYILVSLGACVAMITNQFIRDTYLDQNVSRLGAQVISGIGFLGAGTIIITSRNRVKGLTTAAGLWACACMGLAIGIGFYEGAIISCIFVLLVVTGLHKIDLYSRTHSKIIDVYAELKDIAGVTNFLNTVKSDGTKISNIEIKKSKELDRHIIGLTMTLTLAEKIDHSEYILKLHTIENVCSIEEIM